MKRIILSDWQARALREDRLKLIVVPIRPQPDNDFEADRYGEIHKMHDGEYVLRDGEPVVVGWGAIDSGSGAAARLPYAPGDECFCAEACWITAACEDGAPLIEPPVIYKADTPDGKNPDPSGYPYAASAATMPAWAARSHVRVAAVEFGRVQDLLPPESINTGMRIERDFDPNEHPWHAFFEMVEKPFMDWWDRRYARRGLGWEANPAVAKLRVERIEGKVL